MIQNGGAHPLHNLKLNIIKYFFSEFRNLNKQLKQKLYLKPKINEMLFKLESFQYATSLDLNMVYYHIQLRKNASNFCTIILPWGGYRYKHLPMGVANSTEIFQRKMNDLFHYIL